jgi:L-aspartate oxidase
VAGECAATGLHGANRLASNSLLEGLVFGARVAEDVRGTVMGGHARGLPPLPVGLALAAPPHVLRAAMSRHAGLERSAEGLGQALSALGRLERNADGDLLNMLAAARLVTAAGLIRTESRGAQWRSDFPHAAKDSKRSFLTLAEAERISQETLPLQRAQS